MLRAVAGTLNATSTTGCQWSAIQCYRWLPLFSTASTTPPHIEISVEIAPIQARMGPINYGLLQLRVTPNWARQRELSQLNWMVLFTRRLLIVLWLRFKRHTVIGPIMLSMIVSIVLNINFFDLAFNYHPTVLSVPMSNDYTLALLYTPQSTYRYKICLLNEYSFANTLPFRRVTCPFIWSLMHGLILPEAQNKG